MFPLLRFLPADCSKPGYLKAQMACQEHGGLTTYIDLKEIEQLDNLCGSHKQVTQMLRGSAPTYGCSLRLHEPQALFTFNFSLRACAAVCPYNWRRPP